MEEIDSRERWPGRGDVGMGKSAQAANNGE
jgi:hypothetical protein